MQKILVVEDDPQVVEVLNTMLYSHYFVSFAHTGDRAMTYLKSTKFDLVILDVGLPNFDGYSICEMLRERDSITKVLMLTSNNSIYDKVKGFELGVDDYLTKPFATDELNVRINNLIKNRGIIKYGKFILNKNDSSFFNGDTYVSFSKREFDLFLYMFENCGNIISREELINNIWIKGHNPYPNTIDSHIRRLRKKLEHHNFINLIETIHGVGYRMMME